MRRDRVILYLLLFFLISINYADRVTLSVGSKPIAAEFHLSSVQLGYLFSSFLWTYVIFLIPWGYIADRKGPRHVAITGMSLWSVATVITGFASSIGALFGARLLMGASEASAFPAAGRLIREWVPATEYGLANMIMISGGYAGPAIGSALFGLLASQFGWRQGFIIVGCAGAIWILVGFAWFKKPAAEVQRLQDRPDDAEAAQAMDAAPSQGMAHLLASSSMWGLFFTQGANVYSHYLFLTWLPNYLQTTRHLTILKTGLLSGLPFAIAVFTSLFVAWLSDRLLLGRGTQAGQRRWMVAAMMVLSAIIVLLPFITSIWMIIALITISLTGISTATGLNSALLSDLLQSPADAGKANGILIVGGNLFGTLAPIITGYVIKDTGSFNATWWLCGFLMVLGASICVTMTRRPIGLPPAGARPADLLVSL